MNVAITPKTYALAFKLTDEFETAELLTRDKAFRAMTGKTQGIRLSIKPPIKAKRIAAGTVAFYASVKTYDEFFSTHGFGQEASRIRELFKNNDIKGMIENVPDEMVDVFAIAGNKEFVTESIKRYENIVDEIKLTPPTHFVTEEETRFAQKSILSIVNEGGIN